MTENPTRQARSGGRGARRAMRAAPDFEMLPALKRALPECEPMTPEQIARIDDASMLILDEVGVVFRDDIALEDWRKAGADVRGERVHLDRGLVRELISSIPSSWTYRARNMLLQTEQSITEIAMACGCRSTSHFSKVFRSFFGKSTVTHRNTLG
ncbi:trimethylamine methyltransferase family protein [Defluviimonas sp. WL0002]|uniref:Trimethylamine methyltransferase family protein n=1 Tax=Albidovulum marisflavi TaxID=2984159 RepID=A0ABT2ZHQ6_9RHOB|nr:trimethylamine methyltransferase family protein [Defluviimonas sp. WL0002]MCV2870271.1 trimethylamine methyltransferase family protein [Defluviimonas sp. WL0002]